MSYVSVVLRVGGLRKLCQVGRGAREAEARDNVQRVVDILLVASV